MVFTFIGSWLLASLVRFDPLKWQEILLGKKDDIISDKRDYQKSEIPHTIRNLLRRYMPHSFCEHEDRL